MLFSIFEIFYILAVPWVLTSILLCQELLLSMFFFDSSYPNGCEIVYGFLKTDIPIKPVIFFFLLVNYSKQKKKISLREKYLM